MEAKDNISKINSDNDSIKEQISTFETFVKRRFDEISMEINATSQQIDMNKDEYVKKFTDILEVMGAISYKGSGDTPANTGIELEAVIAVTEQAATKILDAADRIVERLDEDDEAWKNKETRDIRLEKISADVQEILIACAFQDITGQRIRKTLDNLRTVEERLSKTLNKIGIDTTVPVTDEELKIEHGNDQSSVDELFK